MFSSDIHFDPLGLQYENKLTTAGTISEVASMRGLDLNRGGIELAVLGYFNWTGHAHAAVLRAQISRILIDGRTTNKVRKEKEKERRSRPN